MGMPSRTQAVFLLFSLFFVSCLLSSLSNAVSTITRGQLLRDGDTVISEGQNFELGFFSPGNSSSRYVGIWYYNITDADVVWVANRDNPISDRAGVLRIAENGNLVLVDGKGIEVWSSNASIRSTNPTAVLNSDGNLILSGSENQLYWQSFDHPTDTYLPRMRVQVNAQKGENRAFTSWKSANDPSTGRFSMGVDPRGPPQMVIWEGQHRQWRSGYWDRRIFLGVPNMTAYSMHGFDLSNPENESRYFTYTPNKDRLSLRLRFRIRWDGLEEKLRWEEDNGKWSVIQYQPASDCELYNKCGDFGVCSASATPMCSCIRGYVPSDEHQWSKGNWSGGCARRTPLQCQSNTNTVAKGSGGEDGFRDLSCMKLPDFADLMAADSNGTCKEKCLKNCSCTAYAEVNGIGCMLWNGALTDVQKFAQDGSTLFIRLAHSDLGDSGMGKLAMKVIIIIAVAGVFFLGLFVLLVWWFNTKRKESAPSCKHIDGVPIYEVRKITELTDLSGSIGLGIEGDETNRPELPLFNFNHVVFATNNFSEENKLGRGGFGFVYKGKLPWGQEIAVKRLLKNSGQGLKEFMNEVTMIAKLQHRNLVRLLGCCIHNEEKMLLYEYMPNKSLDYFLFGDQVKRSLLDWRKRLTIIEGIARGLLYLHRDSRLKIIHRDLKAANILLDVDLNPKISDFGMARIFGEKQQEDNTNRLVGTYGYMSPEYAMKGLFSAKSDVYSFGVLLLEILSGQRNTNFCLSGYSSLMEYVWRLWDEGRGMDLIDPSILDSCPRDEALRCIHVGMLCVQDSSAQRPSMSSVVLMLEGEGENLPSPTQPICTWMTRSLADTETSNDDVTVRMLSAR